MRRPATRPISAPTTAAIPGRTRWSGYAVLAAACVLVIGVFWHCAMPGLLEARAARAEATYYNLLVQGFRAGQLHLKMEVPAGFAQLADPYDPMANKDYRSAVSNPLHDLSYYRGKLHLYFGITPALVLFWPYAALTGQYLSHRDAVVVFCAIGFLASVGLLYAARRRYFEKVGNGVMVAGTLALGLSTFAPVMLPRCDVYEVAISCGYAFTMLALVGTWRALHEPRHRGRWLAGASLACGLAVGARPSLLPGAAILLIPVFQAWRETAGAAARNRVWVALLAATGPIVLIGLGLMLYNALRFDNPLEFGQRYQLSENREDTMDHFSLRYLWFNFRVFFLEPAQWSSCFPYVRDIVSPAIPTGHVAAIEHPFGVLTNLPLVWLVLAAPLAWRNRPEQACLALRQFLTALTLLFVIPALTISLYSYSCVRYQFEFVPVLVMLAVIGIFGLESKLVRWPVVWRRVVRCGWVLLLIFSVAFNLLAGLDRRAETLLGYGELSLARGQTDQAIDQYRTALRLKPDYADAHGNLGIALGQNGQVDEAIHQLRQAIRLNPEAAEAHNNLGFNLGSKGRIDEAIHEFQEAIRLKPDSAEAHYNLGNALGAKGRIDEAIRQFQEALRLKPDDAETRKNLAAALALQGAPGTTSPPAIKP